MASMWSRFKEFVGLGEEPLVYEESDYSELYQEETPRQGESREERRRRVERLQPAAPTTTATTPEEPPRRTRPTTTGNVIGMPNTSSQAEVFVIEPKSFEDAPQLIQYLRERKSVVLNLTLMEAEQAQRTVDFVAGATYAIDGHQERLGDGIFLFTPSSVLISSAKTQAQKSEEKPGVFKFEELWRSGT
ncbi:cell division protein SepF [Candidatus Cyanaurora vandensis]|uniref:cell division protein SepF n=1 Tax=Candidatus Cyanaurora vandensis TaxID=2714958 RepID=UPI00257D11C9|nr:cell division protein SepF [Candidatus Cyanaurora vandensis]